MTVTQRNNYLSFNQAHYLLQEWLMTANGSGVADGARHTALVLRLSGPVNCHLLERCISEIVRRHHVLRTCILGVSAPYLRVPASEIGELLRLATSNGGNESGDIVGVSRELLRPDLFPQKLSKRFNVDLKVYEVPPGDAYRAAREIAKGHYSKRFDFGDAPLLRPVLFKVEATESWLFIVSHCAVWDGWSSGIFSRELALLYEHFSRESPYPLQELQMQFNDCARLERQRFDTTSTSRLLALWRRSWGNAEPLEARDLTKEYGTFPTARSERTILPEEVRRRCGEIIKEYYLTPYALFVGVLGLAMCAATRRHRIPIVTSWINRPMHQMSGVIGRFSNSTTFVIGISNNEDTVATALKLVRDCVYAASEYEQVPWALRSGVSRPPKSAISFRMIRRSRPLLAGDVTFTQGSMGFQSMRADVELRIAESATCTEVIWAGKCSSENVLRSLMALYCGVLAEVVFRPELLVSEVLERYSSFGGNRLTFDNKG